MHMGGRTYAEATIRSATTLIRGISAQANESRPCEVVRKTGSAVNALSKWPYLYLNATPLSKLGRNQYQHAMWCPQKGIKLWDSQCLPPKGSQNFCAKFVCPCGQEIQTAAGCKTWTGCRSMEFRGKCVRARASGGVARPMTRQEEDLIDTTSIRDPWRCRWKTK